ncbi:hypothetical protein [Sporichthya polymorpha]|uniref:hypothetical protein n=1 Tax=Sporichthya polymorpha TaxID=35751 RepID=UPI00037242AD|nr:hypothetical protein [Sporichthya polymorpha]
MNLVGICVAAATVGVLTAVVASAAPRWTSDAQDRAEQAERQLVLRDAQQRAVGEDRPMCVERESGRWTVRPAECDVDSAGTTVFPDGSVTAGRDVINTAPRFRSPTHRPK